MKRQQLTFLFVPFLMIVFGSCSIGYRSITKTTSETVGKYEKPCPINPVYTDPRDSIEYNIIQIGEQCWMKENLKWLPSVSPATDYSMTVPYYYVYGYQDKDTEDAKQTSNYNNYGVLYNWIAATDACPPGWRLPDMDDWNELKEYMINEYEDITPENINRKLKSEILKGPSMQTKKTGAYKIGWAKSRKNFGTNEFGFSALPGGNYNRYEGFSTMNYGAYFWGHHECSQVSALMQMSCSSCGHIIARDSSKERGLSIRCIQGERDEPKVIGIITEEEYMDFTSYNHKTRKLIKNYDNITSFFGIISVLTFYPGLALLSSTPVLGTALFSTSAVLVFANLGIHFVYKKRMKNHNKNYQWNCDQEETYENE